MHNLNEVIIISFLQNGCERICFLFGQRCFFPRKQGYLSSVMNSYRPQVTSIKANSKSMKKEKSRMTCINIVFKVFPVVESWEKGVQSNSFICRGINNQQVFLIKRNTDR